MGERVAIYGRVSTDEQAERQTIENQLHACHEYCTSRQLEVVEEFLDKGVSGSVPFAERPEGKRLLEVADDGLFDRVIIYRLDRLARDVPEGIIAYRCLKALGAPVTSISESWDDTPSGKLVFNLFISIAEFEKDLIRERTMAGRARKVRNGKYISGSVPPYGYRRSEDGQLEPDAATADVVRRMFEWAVEGIGLKAICTRLDKEGVPPPNARHHSRRRNGWSYVTIYDFLTHPRYIGQATYGQAEIPMPCPVLIDESTFRAAGAALARRKRDSFRNTKYVYPLQHLVWCRTCGSRYMSWSETRDDLKQRPGERPGKVRRYACRRRHHGGPKEGHENIKWRWRAVDLERPIQHMVLQLLTNPEHLQREMEVYVETTKEEQRQSDAQEAGLKERLATLEREELRVLELARKGIYSDETQIRQQLEVVRAQRQQVNEELEALQRPTSEAGRLPLDQRLQLGMDWHFLETLELGKQLQELIPDADWENDGWTDDALDRLADLPGDGLNLAWRETIRELVERIWVEPNGSLTIEGVLAATSTDFTCSSSC